jgi:hypothetical protein
MLEPDTRFLLLDSLRPPPGHELDQAVGTTFTMNLDTLTTVPLAFAMFDQQLADGSLTNDAIATLQALRENAKRITMFSQAGQISVPEEFRSLFVYLENTIFPVIPSNSEAIFHPKVWYLRYRNRMTSECTYRLLCLTRNLTFDRSWDTVLRLDGEISEEKHAPELEEFAHHLLEMAEPVRPLPDERAAAIRQLGEEFSHLQWKLPGHFDAVRFWPLGITTTARNPVPEHYDRILIISPFLTREPISRLTTSPATEQSIVLSRPESFESLGSKATEHLTERLVLASTAANPDEIDDDDEVSTEEAVAESAPATLQGLHAKLYVMDHGDRSRVLTGSTNATWPGFKRNVEFLAELSGPKECVGVEATIGDRERELGLRALVEPFSPENDDPLEPSEAEQVQHVLEKASRALGGLRFTARCSELDENTWRLSLHAEITRAIPKLNEIRIRVRPITLRPDSEKSVTTADGGLRADFELTRAAVTPYFAFSLELEGQCSSFLINAELIDPPEGREADVLRNLLANPQDFIRLLLLLLGHIDDALATNGNGAENEAANKWLTGFGSDALLEPLVRAFARNPDRLLEIERLLRELEESSSGESVLPDGWAEIWSPIAEALESDDRR